jgi:hypothetical protein
MTRESACGPANLWTGEDGHGDHRSRVETRWRELADRHGWRPTRRKRYLPRRVGDTRWPSWSR